MRVEVECGTMHARVRVAREVNVGLASCVAFCILKNYRKVLGS